MISKVVSPKNESEISPEISFSVQGLMSDSGGKKDLSEISRWYFDTDLIDKLEVVFPDDRRFLTTRDRDVFESDPGVYDHAYVLIPVIYTAKDDSVTRGCLRVPAGFILDRKDDEWSGFDAMWRASIQKFGGNFLTLED
jgi:hypothetical protein